MKIHVQFDDPEHGWILLSVQAGEESFEDTVSYTPSDSFRDLVTALSLMIEGVGDAKVDWHAEPITYQMHFTRGEEEITLEVIQFPDYRKLKGQGKTLLRARGSFDDICRPFWKAIRDLQRRFTDEEITRRWHREFPGKAIERLTQRIRESPRN